MTVISMTGFAEAHGAKDTLRWRWEVKSVNGKGLDLRLRMPPGFKVTLYADQDLANDLYAMTLDADGLVRTLPLR